MKQKVVCLHCGKKRFIHGRGLCDYCYEHHRDAYEVTLKRPWTMREVGYLREHYGHTPPREIAHHLGRPYASVIKQAQNFELQKPRTRALIPTVRRRLQLMVDRGYPMTVMAKELNETVWTVSRWLDEIGCRKPTRTGPRSRYVVQLVHWRQKEVFARKGVRCLNDFRRRIKARQISESPWPQAKMVTEVKLMEHLWQHGPSTRREIIAEMRSTTTEHLYSLLKRGLVEKAELKGFQAIYALAEGVRRT